MDVLVTEARPGDAAVVIAELWHRGHRVLLCHEAAEPGTGCAAVPRGACPLDQGAVDVMLAVRRRPAADLTARGYGVVCALRTHTPLVSAHDDAGPLPAWAVEHCSVEAAVETCEAVGASAEVAGRRAVIEAVLRELPPSELPVPIELINHGSSLEVVVRTRRPPEALRHLVELAVREALPPSRAGGAQAVVRYSAS